MKKIIIVLAAFVCVQCGQNKTAGSRDSGGTMLEDTFRLENENLPKETVPARDVASVRAEIDERLRRELLGENSTGTLDQLSKDFLDGEIDSLTYFRRKSAEPKTVGTYVDIWEYIPFFETDQYWKEKSKLALLDERSVLRFKADDDFPKLDGATALYPVYAAFAHAVYPKDVIVTQYDQSQDGWPITFPVPPGETAQSKVYEIMQKTTVVRCSRTRDAYALLFSDDVYVYRQYGWRPDIIFCYEPSAGQRAEAAENGVSFTLTPLGCDAFVFIVHKDNPVDNLTSEQVRAIYSGEITNWKSVTGIDEEIIAYQRPKDSGSQTILEQIMGDVPIMKAPTGLRPYGMAGMVEAVSDYTNYKNSIGYSFRFFTSDMVDSNEIKILSIDGIYPSKENIQNKTYPFVQPFCAVTSGNETPNVQRFIAWMLSPQGQELIEKTGYTPIQ
ncbi:MAG: substrate-binding domain-containing protein [Treponema sp.]|nr:substrate-binding domain-containing protein [Treponema sp.]